MSATVMSTSIPLVEGMGTDPLAVERERDLGDRALWRLHQTVSSPSGVQSGFSSSMLTAARQEWAITVAFFIEDAALAAELGIEAERASRPSPGGAG